MDKRDTFVFYRSFKEALTDLSDKDKLTVYEAISDYALDKIEPTLTGFPKALFSLIKPQLDANWRRFENGQKGAEHGKKGGAPKNNQNAKKKQHKNNKKITNPENDESNCLVNNCNTEDNEQKQPLNNGKITPNINNNINNNNNNNVDVEDKEENQQQLQQIDFNEIVPIEVIIKEMHADELWKEQMCMIHHIGGDTKENKIRNVDKKISIFYAMLVGQKISNKTRKDMYKHFDSWLRKNL